MSAGGQGQVLASTMTRAQNRIAKGSTKENERIYISERRDSTPLRLLNIWLSQPLPALSAVLNYLTVWQAGREVGRVKCLEEEGGCCPFSHYYIFFGFNCQVRRNTLPIWVCYLSMISAYGSSCKYLFFSLTLAPLLSISFYSHEMLTNREIKGARMRQKR